MADERLVKYPLPFLGEDAWVMVPADLSAADAERLCAMVRSLVRDGEALTWSCGDSTEALTTPSSDDQLSSDSCPAPRS